MNDTAITTASQYLTFKIGDELFALDVSQVREVLDLSTITKVPGSPPFMRGVINVRGSVVPVIDLRIKFGLPETVNTLNTRIIVMDLLLDGELTVLGAMADSVHEVRDLEAGQIEKPPKIGMRWRTDVIKGIGKQNDEFIIILDIDEVFSSEELAMVEQTGSEGSEYLKPEDKEALPERAEAFA